MAQIENWFESNSHSIFNHWLKLTKRDELSFFTVLAFPKASRIGLAAKSCLSNSTWGRESSHEIICQTITMNDRNFTWQRTEEAQRAKYISNCHIFTIFFDIIL